MVDDQSYRNQTSCRLMNRLCQFPSRSRYKRFINRHDVWLLYDWSSTNSLFCLKEIDVTCRYLGVLKTCNAGTPAQYFVNSDLIISSFSFSWHCYLFSHKCKILKFTFTLPKFTFRLSRPISTNVSSFHWFCIKISKFHGVVVSRVFTNFNVFFAKSSIFL